MSIKAKNEVSSSNIDPNVIKKEGTFQFPNGDEYNGQFTALKDSLTVIMEGEGTYTTKDGHKYHGVWENNTLVSVYGIQYPDESIFYGQLENMTIQNVGVYKFKEDIELEGNFVNNRLVGKVQIRDPNGHFWIGNGYLFEKDVFFHPSNHFWESVLNIKHEEQSVYNEIVENESVSLVSEDLSSYDK